ncbi:uncharacterized protein LOC135195826 isoform X2 [Macrobrachium nipponense]|uniref:uncharacterized protein LOC135195826 isoform X2 n=1 Tax=Macrobrachium nipponense TaxID=159736 RepID=UPI0030C85151
MNSEKNKLVWNAVPTLFDVANPPAQVSCKRPPPTPRDPIPRKLKLLTSPIANFPCEDVQSSESPSCSMPPASLASANYMTSRKRNLITSKQRLKIQIFNGILLQQPEDIAPSRTTPPPGTRVPSTSREIVQSAIPEPSRNQHLTKRLIRRSTAVDEQHEVLQEALHQLRNFSRPEESENDDESDFGRVVTNDLRKMNEENKVHAQKLISEVLYIGKLGKLSSSMMIVE